VLEDADPDERSPTWTPKLVDKLQASCPSSPTSRAICRPGPVGLSSTIDRDTAARFGITPATVDNALYDAFGQRIVSTIFTQSNQYRVILEADPKLQTRSTR
jgi:multidrug efflux pump